MDFDLKTNEKGNLTIGGVDAVELADQYETPLYVIDEKRIKDNYKRLYNAFSIQYADFKMFYACKANTNLAVMKILEKEGSGIDAVSLERYIHLYWLVLTPQEFFILETMLLTMSLNSQLTQELGSTLTQFHS